ncbi:MAG: thioredoxin family protein [Bacteroidales bacterium]|nr:thioredoxin family protein [Bacteroidales bacterium]
MKKKQMKRSAISGLILLLIPLFSFSQVLDPVQWSFKTKRSGQDEATLMMIAKIDKGWHLYSQHLPSGGPLPTVFKFNESKDYSLMGETSEPKAIEEYDPNFEMILRFFDGTVVFAQKIKILTKNAFTIGGELEYMCCDDHQCLPPTGVDMTFKLDAAGNEAISKQTTPVIAVVATTEPVSDSVTMHEAAEPQSATPTVAEPPVESSTEESSSMWVFFVVALLAGFAGALTPCVYPMIPMTVTFFMSSSKSKAGARANALFYGLSIIVIYTFIGVLVTVLFGSDSIKNISANWITNVIFFLLFTAFAASFFGLFEIVLPAKLTNKSDQQVDKGGLIGTFFMALTLVLVSFSCTAPFIGGILVEASSGNILKPTIGMFGFSLAFALPFTILAFFPSLLSKMPKSGGWLNSVKVVLGFIILALGMKFLLVPNQVLGLGITREIYIAIWIVLFTLMGLYLMGKIKFSHDSDVPHIGVPRLLLIIATFTFVIYLLPGMIGAPLKSVSAFLPAESSFNLVDIIQENRGNGTSPEEAWYLCDQPKYGDQLKMAHGLQGYFDYNQALACAKQQNKPVLIDFTGHGCVNCKVMERTVWPDPEVMKRLREDYIIAALYVDEQTELPESEWITSTVDGKVKKTIGRKNVDFEISRFNVNAQPYYVILDTAGKVLIPSRGFDTNIQGFIDFLDKGQEVFRSERSN